MTVWAKKEGETTVRADNRLVTGAWVGRTQKQRASNDAGKKTTQNGGKAVLGEGERS